MTTKITTDNIASETLTTILGPKVSSIVYPGDDTAANTAGGDSITLLGSGFNNGASVVVNGTSSGVVTVVSSTQITFTAPAQTAGTYVIYVINSDGGTAISIPGISYSGTPTWSTTAGNIGVGYETGSISTTVTASGDAPITYSVVSGTLPAGSSLNTSSGLISGTASATASSTTYSFTIKATDAQNQDTNRAFSITVNPDVVTWSSPANSTTYEVFTNSAIANVAMSATSASGGSITYTADTLPTGLSITGANIAGTPTVAASTSTTLTATSTSTRTATRTINWVVSVANDTFFKNVTLLLNGETTVTPFISDASANSFGLTINGDTKPVLFNPYQGNGYYSNYFDGTGDYLSLADSSAFTLGGSNFTMEAWIYPTAISVSFPVIAAQYTGASQGFFWSLGASNTVNFYFYYSGNANVLLYASNVVVLNSWGHHAVVRNSNTLTYYVNGVSVATIAVTQTATDSSTLLTIGNADGGIYPFTGYISNFRLVLGTAVYTTAFTPPTTPLTAIANTSLLTCQSNRLIDNSTNNFTITKVGDTTVSPAIPFTANSSYSTYGSTYFDGSSASLSGTLPVGGLGSGSFCVEGWIYPITRPSGDNGSFLDTRSGTSVGTGAIFGLSTTNGYPFIYTGGGFIATASVAPALNTWSHLAYVRNGSAITLYLNGVSVATGTTSNNLSDRAFRIASTSAGGAIYFQSYISNFRVVVGSAVYTSAFTPSTTPLTAIANTSLLTLQYNGGATNQAIIDNSNFNNIITRVGNTSQGTFSPYSVTGWSNYFDGTGWLTGTSPSFSTSWTVEFWIYPTSASGTQSMVNFNGTNGINIWKNSSNQLVVDDGSTGQSAWTTVTITLNTWNHIAIVKSGSTTTGYINGAVAGSHSFTPGTITTFTIGRFWAGTYPYYGYISNVRVVNGTAVYTSAFTSPTSPLTPITNTSLLTCQSNRFVDNGPNNYTLTIGSTPSVQAFGPFGSIPEAVPISYSNYFDGTGDYLTVPSNANFTFPADFTIECWIYVPSISRTIQRIFSSNAGPSGACYFSVGNDIGTGAGAGKLCANGHLVSPYTAGFITASTAIPINTWIHAALVRSGSTITIYQDGVSVASATDSATWDFNNSAGVRISGAIWAGSSEDFGGYISNVRVVKGTAVYTSTFTPSTTPLTAIANTSLLTCQSTTMIDNSTNAFTITASGDTKPRIFNPFGYTAQSATSYTPSLHGGSAYFDGTGDYLSLPTSTNFAFGTGDFTCESWVYIPTAPGAAFSALWGDIRWSGGYSSGWYTFINTNLTITTRISGGASSWVEVTSTATLTVNAWNHVAVSRGSSTFRSFINGVLSGSQASATYNYTNAEPFKVGIAFVDALSSPLTGYISDVRVVKGFAVYTSNFVPPAQAVANYSTSYPASLLLNFNNGGIVDQHGTNVLETVGNTQLSTAVKKYNVASMYFDGTGDGLLVPSSINFDFGTGNFTIELWVNFTNVTSTWQAVISRAYAVQGGWRLYKYDASNQLAWYGGDSVINTTGSTLASNTWGHIAVVRNSGTTTIYIDGVSRGSAADTRNYNPGNYALEIGRGVVSSEYPVTGYIDDLRITKGYARYTANFTAPTSAFITK